MPISHLLILWYLLLTEGRSRFHNCESRVSEISNWFKNLGAFLGISADRSQNSSSKSRNTYAPVSNSFSQQTPQWFYLFVNGCSGDGRQDMLEQWWFTRTRHNRTNLQKKKNRVVMRNEKEKRGYLSHHGQNMPNLVALRYGVFRAGSLGTNSLLAGQPNTSHCKNWVSWISKDPKSRLHDLFQLYCRLDLLVFSCMVKIVNMKPEELGPRLIQRNLQHLLAHRSS